MKSFSKNDKTYLKYSYVHNREQLVVNEQFEISKLNTIGNCLHEPS